MLLDRSSHLKDRAFEPEKIVNRLFPFLRPFILPRANIKGEELNLRTRVCIGQADGPAAGIRITKLGRKVADSEFASLSIRKRFYEVWCGLAEKFVDQLAVRSAQFMIGHTVVEPGHGDRRASSCGESIQWAELSYGEFFHCCKNSLALSENLCLGLKSVGRSKLLNEPCADWQRG